MKFAFPLVLAAVTAGPAIAGGWRLTCEATDYRQAKLSGVSVTSVEDQRLNIRARVPAKSTHSVHLPRARLETADRNGEAQYDGKVLKMEYLTSDNFFGEIRTIYAVNLTTGRMAVSLHTQRPQQKFEGRDVRGITGRCSVSDLKD